MALIEVDSICKRYVRRARTTGRGAALRGLFVREKVVTDALSDVSFTIEAGELVGYIGPNGAGKSTTVKLLAGILTPDSGTCRINGLVPWEERREHVARIGVVFGQRTQLWWDLPVIESFDLLADIYRLDRTHYETTRDRLIDRLSIGPFLEQPVRQLSLGQRMRADLAASLLHRPRILFLDEPTIGLDAPGKLAIRDFVRTINAEEGVTVILTTHDMDDIEALSSRLMIINSGRIVADGAPSILTDELARNREVVVDVTPAHGGEARPPEGTLAAALERSRTRWSLEGGRFRFDVDPTVLSVPELIRLVGEQYTMRDISIETAPIEEVVRRIYARTDGGANAPTASS